MFANWYAELNLFSLATLLPVSVGASSPFTVTLSSWRVMQRVMQRIIVLRVPQWTSWRSFLSLYGFEIQLDHSGPK